MSRQTLINKAAADDAYSSQYVPAFGKLINDFYRLKVQAAEDAYPDYAAKLAGSKKITAANCGQADGSISF